MTNKILYFKSFLVGYFAAAILMFTIFFVTMRVHYTAYDFDYLFYAISQIIWLAIPSGILGTIMYKQHLLLRIIGGAVIGLLIAILFVYLRTISAK